jgi:hypothetical protein
MQAPNDNDSGISLFRNVYVDNKTRNPKVKGRNDFRNNVVHNWGSHDVHCRCCLAHQ